MAFCAGCGAFVQENQAFCSGCGKEILAAAPPLGRIGFGSGGSSSRTGRLCAHCAG
jgi:hypothetical protein